MLWLYAYVGFGMGFSIASSQHVMKLRKGMGREGQWSWKDNLMAMAIVPFWLPMCLAALLTPWGKDKGS